MSKEKIKQLEKELHETRLKLYCATEFLTDLYAARKAGFSVTYAKKESFKNIKIISHINMGDLLKEPKKLKSLLT